MYLNGFHWLPHAVDLFFPLIFWLLEINLFKLHLLRNMQAYTSCRTWGSGAKQRFCWEEFVGQIKLDSVIFIIIWIMVYENMQGFVCLRPHPYLFIPLLMQPCCQCAYCIPLVGKGTPSGPLYLVIPFPVNLWHQNGSRPVQLDQYQWGLAQIHMDQEGRLDIGSAAIADSTPF